MGVTIYEIRCVKNNKVYIGQTTNLKNRIKHHFNELQKCKHSNPFLQKDYNNYKKSSFKVTILEKNVSQELKLQKETYWINYYGGTDSKNVYNVKGNGKNSDNKKYAKRKVKAFHNKFDNFKNHKHTEESKLKISNSLKQSYKEGKHILAGAVVNNKGENNTFYGKHHSTETKQLLSKLQTKYTIEDVEKLKSLYSNNLSFKEISTETNIPIRSVKLLIKYGTTSNRRIREIRNSRCNDYPKRME